MIQKNSHISAIQRKNLYLCQKLKYMEKGNQISLWELLFSGQIVTNVFLVVMFVLAVVVLYSFFEKYLSLKSLDTEEDDLLDNIADCLYDHRLDSAKDLCKRISSPEARIIRKGLEKIDKSSLEMFVTIVNQREIETIQLRKDLFKFSLWARVVLFLGVLGTGISIILFFSEGFSDLSDERFYTSFFPVSIGALLGGLIYVFKLILGSLTYRIELALKMGENKFLEIIEEIKNAN